MPQANKITKDSKSTRHGDHGGGEGLQTQLAAGRPGSAEAKQRRGRALSESPKSKRGGTGSPAKKTGKSRRTSGLPPTLSWDSRAVATLAGTRKHEWFAADLVMGQSGRGVSGGY